MIHTLLPKIDENIEQFQLRFSTEEACAEALFTARWPNGFLCPRCNCKRAYPITTRRHFQCIDCGYQASLTAGTIFENTRTCLTKWFMALFFISQPAGINAKKLHLLLGVTYKTAWTILSKIRYALSKAHDSSQLSGNVHVNTDVYGLRPTGSLQAQRGEHPVIIGGSMDAQGEALYIKIKHVLKEQTDGRRVLSFATTNYVKRHVDPKVKHVHVNNRRFDKMRNPSLRSAVKNVTKWIHNTFGGIGTKHLQTYFDEFAFRHNALHAKASQSLFTQLLYNCISQPGITYAEIIHGNNLP